MIIAIAKATAAAAAAIPLALQQSRIVIALTPALMITPAHTLSSSDRDSISIVIAIH